jgi:hypothetical protein
LPLGAVSWAQPRSANRRYSAAMVPYSPWPLLAVRGICGNNQQLQTHHNKERHMKRIAILFGLLCGSVLLANPVFANDAAQLQCEAQAAAKKLNGAAKTSFVGKCVKDAAGAATGECEKAAADKKLAGAAKNSFIQKCVKTGAAMDPAAKCEKAAADKKLAGAAKNSFVQKCVKSA